VSGDITDRDHTAQVRAGGYPTWIPARSRRWR